MGLRIKNSRAFPHALAFGRNSADDAFLAVIVKGTFRIERRAAPARRAAQQLPAFEADTPYDPRRPDGPLKFESDRVPFKPRADVVLVGSAHTPFGRPQKSIDVLIQVGQTRRVLRVFGDRVWSFGSEQEVAPRIAGPSEFVEMPLSYERAFGGSDELIGVNPNTPWLRPWCEQNLLGRGFCAARSVASIHQKPLPNIEDPDNLISAWDSRPTPVGCGFFPRNSKPRVTFAGTYDDKWRATRAPLPPEDFRYDVFNGADPSLQVKGYLVGNERVSVSNVTPGGGTLEFCLPCVRPRLEVDGERGAFSAHAQLDTLVFIPEQGIFYQVWRGVVGITQPDASDLREIRVEYEALPPAAATEARALR